MISLNKGEWSELYGVLYLLVNPHVQIVNSRLELVSDFSIFTVRNIVLESTVKIEYEIANENVIVYIDGQFFNSITNNHIEFNRKLLLERILGEDTRNGSFDIPDIDLLLVQLSNGHVIKGSSRSKSDITLKLYDHRVRKLRPLNYSVKSSLGNPATILNASRHTNFLYEIEGLSANNVLLINSIEGATKLLDRIELINRLGAKITFSGVSSEAFEYNLRMIDSLLPEYLANTLLYSYSRNIKDLKRAFIEANNFPNVNLGLKKLGDFLIGISFGFIPSVIWDGRYEVNGGLMLVTSNGEVVFLDLVYFEDEVKDFIIHESKLDSPSSTRYNMLELKTINDKVSFTLNLQVRYKR